MLVNQSCAASAVRWCLVAAMAVAVDATSVARIFAGDFDGSSETLASCAVTDDDGDVTTLAGEADHTVVFVKYAQSGFNERVGIAQGVKYNADTMQLGLKLHKTGRQSGQKTWKMALRAHYTLPRDLEGLLRGLRRVCRETVAYSVEEEEALRDTSLEETCAQYTHLLGSSVVGAQQDAAVEHVAESVKQDCHAIQSGLVTLQQTNDYLREEAVPSLVVVARQLEQLFADLDAMEPCLDSVLGYTDQLDKCVSQYTAPPSTRDLNDLKEKAKKFLWGRKKADPPVPTAPAIPRDYTVGGVPPAEFLNGLHETLAQLTPQAQEAKEVLL